jgi:hypothetical protein
MTKKNDSQSGTPEDENFFVEFDEPGREKEQTDDLELGANADAEAMVVSLKRATHAGEDCVEVYAHGDAYPEGSLQKTQQTALLARVTERELTMFPLVSASYRPAFLTPKYDELTTITILANGHESWWLPETIPDFDGLLESLPIGFGRHAKYGLGFRKEYRLIPDAILELHGITELVIEPGDGAVVQLPKFRLGMDRFSAIRRSIDSIIRRSGARSLRDRRLFAFNELLHVADPVQFERRFAKVKPGEIYELVKLGGRAQNRSADDRLAAAMVI